MPTRKAPAHVRPGPICRSGT